MFTTQDEWDRGYTEGRRYRPLTDTERSLLATHLPPAAGGRALEVGCGTGELAAHLSSSGYTVDAIGFKRLADVPTPQGRHRARSAPPRLRLCCRHRRHRPHTIVPTW
ncbi:hypothetical protein [Streptomyces mirabilis]|uniref:hypothetical protein n=1 Tax=Streptomyces mirabilis TaxID=68239 RepID=UPI0033BDEDB3